MILPFRVTRWRRTASRTCRIFNIAFNSPEKISTSTSSRPRNLETKCSRLVSPLHVCVYLSLSSYLFVYPSLCLAICLSVFFHVVLFLSLLSLLIFTNPIYKSFISLKFSKGTKQQRKHGQIHFESEFFQRGHSPPWRRQQILHQTGVKRSCHCDFFARFFSRRPTDDQTFV